MAASPIIMIAGSKTSGCIEKEPSSIAFVWPIWRVYPKKLTGECGWNYMK